MLYFTAINISHDYKSDSISLNDDESIESLSSKSRENIKSSIDETIKTLFNPEFLNRIDDIIVFKTLNKNDIFKIIDLFVNDIKVRLKEKGIQLSLTDNIKDIIAEKGYNESYGARALRREFQKYVEDELSEEILKQDIKSGTEIILDYNKEKGKVEIKRK